MLLNKCFFLFIMVAALNGCAALNATIDNADKHLAKLNDSVSKALN